MKSSRGFSLIELIVAVTIVGIIAAIAFPTYMDQVTRSRRSDGQTAILNAAALMEHYYTENNTYVGATLANLGITSATQQGYYTISLSALTTSTYTITATPVVGGPQASDATCGALSLTQANVKAPNPSVCWD